MNKNLPYSFSVPSSWYDGFYVDQGDSVKASRPFTLLHENKSGKAVLLIHGFTGYPGELVRPAEDLYEKGFDVFVPRLPGHGTTGKDFIKSRKEDWIGVPEKALLSLEKEYESVSVVGHSMGGAIAAILLSRHPEIERGVLCCPGIALKSIDDKMAKAISFMSHFTKRIKQKWQSDPRYHMHYEDAPGDDEYLGSQYWSYAYPKQIISLLGIAKEAEESLKNIKSPTLVIGAEKDVLTEPGSIYTIAKAIGDKGEAFMVKDANHYIYYDISPEAEEKAVEATVSFLSR